MTDFRKLCKELVQAWDEHGGCGIPYHEACWSLAVDKVRKVLDEVVEDGPTDEDILRFADDLSVLKGYAVDGYSKWVFSEYCGYGDYHEVDATNEVLALARFVTTTLPPTPGRKSDVQ